MGVYQIRTYSPLPPWLVYSSSMRYLGVDYGSKRIGVALSDPSGSMAFPECVIENKGLRKAAEELLRLAREKGVEAVVLGESRDYQGRPNAIHAQVQNLKVFLEAEFAVFYESETLTSAEAARGETNQLDASAAAIILNSFLTRKRLMPDR